LAPGIYSNIHKLQIHELGEIDFGDVISSVQFNSHADTPTGWADVEPDVPSEGDAAQLDSVPLVVEVWTHPDDGLNKWLTIIENVPNIKAVFGAEFNDAIWFVRVRQGSHYAGEIVRLHRDPDYHGGHMDIPAEGTYLSLQQANFTDVASSIDIVQPGTPWPLVGRFKPQNVRLDKVKRTPV
jgi:hypothetical protein